MLSLLLLLKMMLVMQVMNGNYILIYNMFIIIIRDGGVGNASNEW